MTSIRVHKLNEHGKPVFHYDGQVLGRDVSSVQLEAFFQGWQGKDVVRDYHTFRRGDRMVEWFYSDRWYNIFEMYDVDDGRLKGWYCNITRPARIEADAIYAEDLALDVMVYPDGRYIVLDEDEFAALDIDDLTRQQARLALENLVHLIEQAQGVFIPLKQR
jgi:hypothetical protein